MHEISRRLISFWREGRKAQGPVPLHAPIFEGRERDYVTDCIETGWVSSVGAYVDRFEAMLAEITGVGRAIATVNGSAALEVCLHLAGVRPGDAVAMPSLTFVATANAAAHLGAVCHFVDVEETTLGLDPVRLDEHLTRHPVKAVVAMHTFGHPVALDEVAAVCDRHGAVLVEDAAESLGSSYKGRHTGRHGRLAALSFNGNKIVTTGGGGAILTDDPELAQRAKHLTTTAKLAHPYRFDHDETGWNFRMPNLNAALGCAQLESLAEYVERKRTLVGLYAEALAGLEGARLFREQPHCRSNYWLAALMLDRPDPGLVERVIVETGAAGIQCRPVWTPMHQLPMYRNCPRGGLPVTEALAGRLINIPSSPARIVQP